MCWDGCLVVDSCGGTLARCAAVFSWGGRGAGDGSCLGFGCFDVCLLSVCNVL